MREESTVCLLSRYQAALERAPALPFQLVGMERHRYITAFGARLLSVAWGLNYKLREAEVPTPISENDVTLSILLYPPTFLSPLSYMQIPPPTPIVTPPVAGCVI